MKPPGIPLDESARIQALRSYHILDSEPESAFDDLVELAAQILGVPIMLVSLVDTDRQWFKSCIGLHVRETPRAISFCGHVVEGREALEVRDARLDPRFADNPLVEGEPFIRFYAGQPLHSPDGHVLGTLCAIDQVPRVLSEQQRSLHRKLARQVSDQLELRAKARELQQEKGRLRAIFDAMTEGVVLQDRLGQILSCNPAAERLLGLSFEQMAGRSSIDPLWSCCHADGSPFPGEEHPAMVVLRTGQPVHDVTMGVRKPSGELSWIHVSSLPIHDAQDSGQAAVVSSFHDLTERLNAEGARRARLLDTVLGNLPSSSLAIFDQDLFIRERFGSPVHPASEPGPGDELITSWAPPELRGEFRAAALRCLRGETARFELLLGRTRLDVRLVPLPDANLGVTRGLALAYDVSERDELRERAERHERLASVGTLAAGVGHEINNPLTFISSNIEFALEELRSSTASFPVSLDPVIEALVEAHDGAARIGKIVRGLRAFAVNEGVLAPSNARQAIEIAANMSRHEIRLRASLSLTLDPVPAVLADESRLTQVIVNLLVNAAQAFPSSDPTRNQISLQTQLSGDGRVLIRVSDNGPGIPPEVLPRIFDPFFTTKGVGKGTGLGLSISSNIIRSFGGELLCDTTPGVGTTFRVFLLPAPEAQSPLSVRGAPSGRVGRILVIDDEQAVLNTIVRTLRSDWDLVALSDPRDALQRLLGGESFDVILCDIMMPHLNGIELFLQVRASSPLAAARFVFLSGGVLDEEMRSFLGTIPNTFLEKPFSSRDLRAATRRCLADHAPAPPPPGGVSS